MKVFRIAVAGFLACAGVSTAAHAQGVVITCVGPKVDRVIPGDWQHGIPDKVIGATPDIFAGPGSRPTGGKLPTGGAYLADRHVAGYYRLVGTRYSPPVPPGTIVGWVRDDQTQFLALRNCN